MLPQHHREVASVVARAFALFVAGVVFFVDYDEAQLRQRGQQCAAGTDQDGFLGAGDLTKALPTFAVSQGRMQMNDLAREAGLEPSNQLRRQTDFRYQH